MRAARLFNEKGYFGASLADLMEATGLKKGGLYNHFESKEKLAREAFDYAIVVYGQRFEEALAGKTHAADRLLAIVDIIRRSATDPPIPGGCVLLNAAVESDDAFPALRERARKAMDSWRKLVRRTVEAGLVSGEILRGVDAEQTASLLIDPIHVFRAADHVSRHVIETIRVQGAAALSMDLRQSGLGRAQA
jgi:AcrR family transcriptional regulator